MPKLSILICTLHERAIQFRYLKSLIEGQMEKLADGKVELIYMADNGQMIVGEKRNALLKLAKGDFIAFVDDDDVVANHYVSDIVQAIEENPDIDNLAICGVMTTNGADERKWFISNKLEYEEKNRIYYRPVNHICPVRREHALAIGFPLLNCGEDYDYCMRLKKSGLLKKEVSIDRQIYHYQFNTKETRTQR